MWRLILGVVLTLLFANSTSANAENEIEVIKDNSVIQTQANEDGKVILDEVKSLDNSSYILNDVEPLQPALIKQLNTTTFSVYDYADGFFDNPTRTWPNTIPAQIIDNDLTTYSQTEFKVTFDKAIKVKKVYVNGYGPNCIFYDAGSNGLSIQDSGIYDYNKSLSAIECKKKWHDSKFYEIEIFSEDEILYIAASDLNVDASEESATVTFKKPDSKYFVSNDILLDGKVVESKTNQTSIELTDLKAGTNYEITVRSHYTDGIYVDAVKSFRTKKDTTRPNEVTGLTAKQVGNTVVLNWTNPTDKDLEHIRITRNGMLKADKIKDETYIDEAPLFNTDNVYRVIAIDASGNYSSGTSVTVKVIGTEVFSVLAKAASHDKVDLSWKNPQRDDFETVRIARKNQDSGIMKKIATFFSGSDGYTDLFQTNGTIFNDLTVSADTQYTYRLRTVLSGDESPGVTVDVKTPKLTASGGGVTVDPEKPDSYTISWTSPTTGKMKILVGGKEYKTVSAADKNIVIPATDMKFDLIGKPDVKLVPIGDDGKEGVPTSPGGTTGGGGLGDIVGGGAVSAILNGNNLLKAGVALLGVIGGFVLLGLAFRVVPKLIQMIRTAYVAKAERGMNR